MSYIYLDTAGKVTVGVGNMLPDAGAAKKLAFERRPDPTAKPPVTGGKATDDEIQSDFDNVNKQTAGKLYTYYKQFTKLDLPDSVIDSLLDTRVTEFLTQLGATFPDFATYPEDACAAIFDMAFNLGISGLTSKFPTFCKAVKDKDWATCAKECKRGGIPDKRNDWTKAQFDKVVSDAKAAADAAAKAAAGTK